MSGFQPLLVHLAIVLLTLYSVFELVSFRWLQEKPFWFYVKAILVVLGLLAFGVAFFGGAATESVSYSEALLATYRRFSIALLVVFGFVSLLYTMVWLGGRRALLFSSKLLFNRGAMIPIALAGLVAILISGGLGGTLTYGPYIDPLMTPILKYWGIN